MQTYIADLIPKIQKYSRKLDEVTLLSNQHWVMFDESGKVKTVYIFRSNNDLIISSNGEVEKGRWEYLGNNSLLIDKASKIYLFKHGFFDKNVLALKIDGKEEYVFFINESRYNGELNSFSNIINFLSEKYVNPPNGVIKKLTPSEKLELKAQKERDIKIQNENEIVLTIIIITLMIFLFMVYCLHATE